MIIESSAPPRVDLAGGTIDIWPLYLFHPGATTVNFALSLYARCRIETRDDGRVVLESRDRKVAFETELSAIEDLFRKSDWSSFLSSCTFLNRRPGFTWSSIAMFPQVQDSVVRQRSRLHVSAR